MTNRASIFLAYPSTKESRVGMYLGTGTSGTVWPELLRRAIACNPPVWDNLQLLSAHLVTNITTASPDDHVTLSMALTDPVDYPIIVVDLSTKVVAFAPSGGETRTINWHGHKMFNHYTTLLYGKYPMTNLPTEDTTSPLAVYQLTRDHTGLAREEVIKFTVIARGSAHARDIAAHGAGAEGHSAWMFPHAVCKRLGPTTDKNATQGIICAQHTY